MAMKVSKIAMELADREAIRDCLLRYPRAQDRIEFEGAEFFWPDATDDHAGIFNGKFSDYLVFLEPLLRPLGCTQHFLANMLIEIDGEEARVETYVLAYHSIHDTSGKSIFLAAGRYLDVLSKRADEWRIAKRTLVIDWMKHFPDSPAWEENLLNHVADGKRNPDDKSAKHFRWIK